jgi:hypothetical protein
LLRAPVVLCLFEHPTVFAVTVIADSSEEATYIGRQDHITTS